MEIMHAISVIISLALMYIILLLVYKRMLREEYSLLWLAGGITLVILSLFRSLLIRIAAWLDITYTPSLLFAVGILFVIIIVLTHAVSITTLIKRDRDLAQKTAILEWRIEQIKEENVNKTAGNEQVERPPVIENPIRNLNRR